MDVTIAIPEELFQRLQSAGIDASTICEPVLRARVDEAEALVTNDEATAGVLRLRAERAKALAAPGEAGQRDGRWWALNQATYQELVDLQRLNGTGSSSGVLSGRMQITKDGFPSLFNLNDAFKRNHPDANGASLVTIDRNDKWFDGFVRGALDVLESVHHPERD